MSERTLVLRPAEVEHREPAFLLVHGTWAPDAPWTDMNGEFVTALRGRFEGAPVVTVDWTGANTFEARREAVAKVKHATSSLRAEYPGRALFILAHSHGGSAVAYALRDEFFAQTVAGVVFLSTPFISVAGRPGYRSLVAGQIWTLVAVGACTPGFLAGYLFPDQPEYGMSRPVAVALLFAFGLALAAPWLKKWSNGWRSRYERWLGRHQVDAVDLTTCRPLGIDALYVRVTADEVTLGLGVAQFLAAISSRLCSLLALVLAYLERGLGWIAKRWLGRILLAYLAIYVSVAFVGAGETVREGGFSGSTLLADLYPFDFDWQTDMGPYSFEEKLLTLLDVPVVLCLAATETFAILLLISTLIAVATFRAFGGRHVIQALAVECAVEPVPEGRCQLEHLAWENEWGQRAVLRTKLWHGESYSSKALAAFSGWIGQRLLLDRPVNSSEGADRA